MLLLTLTHFRLARRVSSHFCSGANTSVVTTSRGKSGQDQRQIQAGGSLAGRRPKNLTQADASRLRDEVGQYAQSRGKTEGELERDLGMSPAEILAMVWGAEQHGGTTNGALRSLEGCKASLNDTEKVKLLECMGVKSIQ